MKKTSKIFITILLVISMLAAFCVIAFATNEITIDNQEYNYKATYNFQGASDTLKLYNVKTFELRNDNGNNTSILINSYEISNDSNDEHNVLKVTYSSTSELGIIYFDTNNSRQIITMKQSNNTNYSYIEITTSYGDVTYKFSNNAIQNVDNYYYFDLNYNYSGGIYNNNSKLLLNIKTSIYDKIDAFFTYLSTSLNKLTTMIIANQILILFIVAVPVVSFVIGSFKRIKDSGRV